MDAVKVKKEAEKELEEERFREAVEQMKSKLRQKKPLLHKIFPWKITIQRRD